MRKSKEIFFTIVICIVYVIAISFWYFLTYKRNKKMNKMQKTTIVPQSRSRSRSLVVTQNPGVNGGNIGSIDSIVKVHVTGNIILCIVFKDVVV